ncbi:MAG: ATP-binding protein [Desulfobacteraceae bacterium]|nr:ATP-binding protein [Desulfobacteraceae bacterium]
MKNIKRRRNVNPFGVSRVDNPFQDHVDLKTLFSAQFTRLKSIIDEISDDKNHQSRGVIIAGEPGAGKTHLIMRLAKERIGSNRILFIRQPNNPDAVFYHIYARIVESLVQKVPETQYTQIEYLLAKSFSKIFINDVLNQKKPGPKMLAMKAMLEKDHLNLLKKLGSNNNEEKRLKNWRAIEKRTLEWWGSTHGWGIGAAVVRAFVKYCSYPDFARREIVRKWLIGLELSKYEIRQTELENINDKISSEEFALEAISVLGKLSVQDEPLILVFDQLEGLKYNEDLLMKFGEDIKELFTHIPNCVIIFNFFPDRWEEYSNIFDESIVQRMSKDIIALNTPSQAEMKTLLRFRAKKFNVDIDSICLKEDFDVILKGISIRNVLNKASDYYKFRKEGIPLPQQIQKFTGFDNKITEELDKLKQQISWIREYLNIEALSDDEQKEMTEIRKFLRKYEENAVKDYEKYLIVSDSDDIGKIDIIIKTLMDDYLLSTSKTRLGRKKLPEHIKIKDIDNKNIVISFLHIDGKSFSSRIKNFNSIVWETPDTMFYLYRDKRAPAIHTKKSLNEIKWLNSSDNGNFRTLNKDDRIKLEVIYKIITDIQNRELDININSVIKVIKHLYNNFWLLKLIDTE